MEVTILLFSMWSAVLSMTELGAAKLDPPGRGEEGGSDEPAVDAEAPVALELEVSDTDMEKTSTALATYLGVR